MLPYFHKTELDAEYYEARLKNRLPRRIIDAHAHFNLPEHISGVSEETIAGDWACECGMVMTYEDAAGYMSAMFHDKDVGFVALPWPLRDADTIGNNAYIASLIKHRAVRGLYTLRPEYDTKQIERDYLGGGFCGFKPYPYMASPKKGAEVSIFEFMTREQFRLANKLRAAVLMHLPRAGRLPDPDNISEIKEILDDYPDVRLVVAHFGRCFQHEFFEKGLEALGAYVSRLWFDTAAVLNAKVYKLAGEHLDHKRIIYGTDMPVMLWHGRREWDENGYYNLCREDFSWNTHKYPDEEPGYTYFIYEQINNILNEFGHDPGILDDIFRRNAEAVYRISGV